MIFHVLDLLYYILAKMAVTNKAITIIILKFKTKIMDNKNKYL